MNEENPQGLERFDNAEQLYIGAHQDEPFIISDRSEKKLLSQLSWKVFALLYGGPTLTVTCIGIILTLYVTTGP